MHAKLARGQFYIWGRGAGEGGSRYVWEECTVVFTSLFVCLCFRPRARASTGAVLMLYSLTVHEHEDHVVSL